MVFTAFASSVHVAVAPLPSAPLEICTDVLIYEPPPKNVTVGAVTYPDPTFVIVTPVKAPHETVAVPVAVVPLGGSENVTVGVVSYPEPPADNVTDVI